VWRSIDPTLEFLTLPRERKLDDDEVARIDLAVFSSDLWRERRGAPFMKVLLQAPNARWLHMFSAGLDDPVFGMLAERGLTVTHSAGSSAIPIAHTVIMHVISLCRESRAFAVAQTERRWANSGTQDVEGRRMAIVGLGAIGSEVARLAAHFGIHVIGLRRTPTGDEPCQTWTIDRLHELLPHVDDLVLTAPLTPDTRGIIGAPELALLPPGAHVVNVGRGELIDEAALVAALRSGHLGGAALDVFVVEPLPEDSELWHLPNVIVTPHSAGTTPLSAARAADIFADNLLRFTEGRPLRKVGP
jgi:D-2-hydroxyacid dehydrogenase (NADP+)